MEVDISCTISDAEALILFAPERCGSLFNART